MIECRPSRPCCAIYVSVSSKLPAKDVEPVDPVPRQNLIGRNRVRSLTVKTTLGSLLPRQDSMYLHLTDFKADCYFGEGQLLAGSYQRRDLGACTIVTIWLPELSLR